MNKNEPVKVDRTKSIIRTSIVGIVVNILLSVFKAVVGTLSNSIAITMDAVNNLSDSMSSLITMVGTKLSTKEPDRKHPFGYGRIEYITTLVIGTIIFYAGIVAIEESINKIIKPQNPDYSKPALIIVSAAIVAKIILGLYTQKAGKKLMSASLEASGRDSLNDAVVSGATLLAAIVYITSGYSIEAYVGILIGALILKTGFEVLKETISEILGERISSELAGNIKKSVRTFHEVEGVYDVTVHSYGKEKLIGSVHIEVPESLTASYLDGLERSIVDKVYKDTGVILTGISVYSMNRNDTVAIETKDSVKKIIDEFPQVLGMHGFYKNNVDKTIRFDIVIDFDTHQRAKLVNDLIEKIRQSYPEYETIITLDYNISD